jgi:hypothetical protein
MEKEPLTKSDLCWVVVKVIGVILVYQAIATLGGALFASIAASEGALLFSGFVVALFPLLIGLSLLISGTTLHGWLMMVPLGSATNPMGGESLAEKRLSSEEYEIYLDWLGGNEEAKDRDEFFRLALFRDAQRRGEI